MAAATSEYGSNKKGPIVGPFFILPAFKQAPSLRINGRSDSTAIGSTECTFTVVSVPDED
jgi:hypothetical protein